MKKKGTKIKRSCKINKYKSKEVSIRVNIRKIKNEFALSENNRLTYIFKLSSTNKVIEVVCVSLEIRVAEKWMTIVYYDSTHEGKLHKHKRVSLADQSDSPTYLGVRQKGTQRRLLTWAIKDIKSNYLSYKKDFVRRSKDSILAKGIEIF